MGSTECDTLEADWEEFHANPPECLYHYTTALGLLGMLEKGRLWATNARFMNDPTEGRYAQGLVREVLKEEAATYEQSIAKISEGQNWFERLLQKFSYRGPEIKSWIANTLQVLDRRNVFVCCFCPDGDLLSQWRGYGATGAGYAVGFETVKLKSVRQSPYTQIRKIIYDEATQRRILKKKIKQVLEVDLKWRKGKRDAMQAYFQVQQANPFSGVKEKAEHLRTQIEESLRPVNQEMDALERFLAECLICFKHPGYAEENEWRLFQFAEGTKLDEVQPSILRFRDRRGLLVPYIEFDMTLEGEQVGKMPLRRLYYGPTLEWESTNKAIKMLLVARGYGEIDVRRSRVPFIG